MKEHSEEARVREAGLKPHLYLLLTAHLVLFVFIQSFQRNFVKTYLFSIPCEPQQLSKTFGTQITHM